MPWYNGDFPPSYKNQPPKLREKAVEIANEILKESGDEGIGIATGLKRAREYFKARPDEADPYDQLFYPGHQKTGIPSSMPEPVCASTSSAWRMKVSAS